MLIGIVVIGAFMVLCMAARPAYADDAELAQLQQQIETTAQEYDDATSRVAQLQQQMDDNKARIAEINAELPEQQNRSNDAIKALYILQQEGYSLLNMVLNSESLTEFLTSVDYIDCIQQHNSAQVEKLANMRSELEDTQAQIASDQREATSEADRAQSALSEAQAARQEAEQRAIAEAAAQLAAAQAAAEAQAASAAQASSSTTAATTGVDSGNTQATVSNTTSSGDSASGTVSSGSVNWSADKAAFVSEWTSRLDDYLSGSPLAGQGATFAEAAWNYGVDPRWSPAIAYAESSLGAACFLPHNAWGWGSSSWSTWEAAINDHVAGLARGYGSTLTYAAAQKYCPPNADHWYNVVLAQMNSI